MSSVYTVRYAPQALDDLRDLYSYVALSLKEPATAQKLVNRIRKAARSLDALPGRYPVVDWEPWQSMGMHRFTVENFSVVLPDRSKHPYRNSRSYCLWWAGSSKPRKIDPCGKFPTFLQ